MVPAQPLMVIERVVVQNINIIDKYDFSSDGNATDVGDLQGTDNGYTGGVTKLMAIDLNNT